MQEINSIQNNMLTYTTTSTSPAKIQVDILGIFLFKEDNGVAEAVQFLSKALQSECIQFARKIKFSGRTGETMTVVTAGRLPSFLVLFAGLGKKGQPLPLLVDRIRDTAARLCLRAKEHHAKSIAFILPQSIQSVIDGEMLGESLAEGATLGTYTFSKYKQKKQESSLAEVVIVSKDPKIKRGFGKGQAESKGVLLARDLVNEPAHIVTPHHLLLKARYLAKRSQYITVKSFDKTELKRLGFGGISSVAKGSENEAYLIHLTYRPTAKKTLKKIAVVGKGITFDSGGLSLKPAQYMENMKIDMAGGATVLGLFQALSDLKPNVEVHGIISACENMPSGAAIKPGDVITIKNGKTVEVLNTDAEGRLVLADALSYAVDLKADEIIDFATLTGACVVALGSYIAGIMGNDQTLVDKLILASKMAGEHVWQLPLPREYRQTIKSAIADLRNTSTMNGGGAITAGLFLQNFVGGISWAHFDIAGPAWLEKPYAAHLPKGATGFGVRTLVHYIEGIK